MGRKNNDHPEGLYIVDKDLLHARTVSTTQTLVVGENKFFPEWLDIIDEESLKARSDENHQVVRESIDCPEWL